MTGNNACHPDADAARTAETDRRIERAESALGVTLAEGQRAYVHEYVRALHGEAELPLAAIFSESELATLGAALSVILSPAQS